CAHRLKPSSPHSCVIDDRPPDKATDGCQWKFQTLLFSFPQLLVKTKFQVNISKLTVLNYASTDLPMLPSSKATEKTRLHCRHIDLRTDRMQRALRIRSDVVHKMRRFLIEYAKFVDVETPTLFRRTPGGSAEFLVPAPPPNRGLCYSLPQSPQQFKQLLMVGGIDRYFQDPRVIDSRTVPCFSQPTLVDLELSFTTQDGVMSLVEELLIAAWPEELVDLKPCAPFPRLKYRDAMRQYGSDKPDMRIPWHIEDCTELLGRSLKLKIERGLRGTTSNFSAKGELHLGDTSDTVC
ncbi:unnamed protein product, partial [Haemonchus placei]|uniref:tRNA-synt_2 domain-containing protein n=1 Tax=Haemonchus placei TaxID=6290 RepID=A0A158QM69_HAEPC